MKNGIHPSNYRFVVFQDMSNGQGFLSKSTAPQKRILNGRMVMNTRSLSLRYLIPLILFIQVR